MIALTDCLDRHIYRLRSRNLVLGVFVQATRGFIGIREKLGARYLFTEYHVDTGPPLGTARPLSDTGEVVPDTIDLEEHLAAVNRAGERRYWADNVPLHRLLGHLEEVTTEERTCSVCKQTFHVSIAAGSQCQTPGCGGYLL